MKITDFMEKKLINLNLNATDKKNILKELGDLIGKSKNIINKEKCFDAIVQREKLGSTGIGKNVAIPHAKTDYARELTVAFGISKSGIDFESLDNEKTHIFFLFASPLEASQTYLKILARISRLIRNEEFRKKLLFAKTNDEILKIIDTEEIF